EFIQVYGLNHLAPSLEALKEITILFTGEFAVRPFIKKYPQKTLAFLKACAKSDNAHVRRWASEGSRPRLPWGERLDLVIQNPTLTLEILELLKHDPELYVRKSVANHLNDISKDNPKVAIETLKRWSKASRGQDQNIAWITRHALRTLIKKGDPAALALIGIKRDIKISVKKLKTDRASYRIGDKLEFSFEIVSTHTKPQDLVIDYIVHYVKSNGATSPKVFKFKTLTLKPDERVALRKVHHLKQVTTRRHYSGKHTIEIQINGLSQGKTHWPLKAD
ncbi:MAG: DNA alkylation repair protein, partial [Bdellovibrionales bacterium]|nr:DNA alkylation repair protein [Bdellovibrionales bacterium]